jgi:hypothetical protein
MIESNPPSSLVTDIWFYTDDGLSAVAEKLGLERREPDCEDTWEWVIGDLFGVRLDITRHQGTRKKEETAIFLFEPPKAPWSAALQDAVLQRLGQVGYSDIWVGRLTVNSANRFEKVVVGKF